MEHNKDLKHEQCPNDNHAGKNDKHTIDGHNEEEKYSKEGTKQTGCDARNKQVAMQHNRHQHKHLLLKLGNDLKQSDAQITSLNDENKQHANDSKQHIRNEKGNNEYLDGTSGALWRKESNSACGGYGYATSR